MKPYLLIILFVLGGCKAFNSNAYEDQTAANNACVEKGTEMGLKRITCSYNTSKGSYVELLIPDSLGGKNQRFWF